MTRETTILGVYLSDSIDLETLYGAALKEQSRDVELRPASEIEHPEDVRFAVCWLPGPDAFAPYPDLDLAMSIGAGVDALLAHSELSKDTAIARVRDPHQADQMAGYVAHQILERERGFDVMRENAAQQRWAPAPLRPPASTTIAVLGHGTMGRAVVRGLRALGFSLRVACRSTPRDPVNGVTYLTGDTAVQDAAQGAHYLVNVLPLTAETENVLNATLFARLARGAWLIQIGRGEHLVEEDLREAVDRGILSGATLDVFREEPLPANHPFWTDPKLVITPHIASDTAPEIVAEQVVATARALRDGTTLDYAIDRQRGY